MARTRKRGMILAGIAAVLVILAGWLFLWHRIASQLQQAQDAAAYIEFRYAGAYYTECDLSVVQLYAPDITELSHDICGSVAGEVTDFPHATAAVQKTAYHLAALESAGKRDGILLLEDGDTLRCYELTGFQALDDAKEISDVCAAYGITGAEDLLQVTVAEVDGTLIDTLTDAADLEGFYEKFVALGTRLGTEEQMRAYYDAYDAVYDAEADLILDLEQHSLTPTSDAAQERAYALWGEGMCVVTLELRNGLQISDMIYAPTPGLFTVYGQYRLSEPFFS